MSNILAEAKSVVIVHGREQDDIFRILNTAGLQAPLSILGFTDLVTEANPYNANLVESVQRADEVLLQREGLGIATSAVELAVKAALSAPSNEVNVSFFNTNYEISNK